VPIIETCQELLLSPRSRYSWISKHHISASKCGYWARTWAAAVVSSLQELHASEHIRLCLSCSRFPRSVCYVMKPWNGSVDRLTRCVPQVQQSSFAPAPPARCLCNRLHAVNVTSLSVLHTKLRRSPESCSAVSCASAARNFFRMALAPWFFKRDSVVSRKEVCSRTNFNSRGRYDHVQNLFNRHHHMLQATGS
jgi:hypothetical protein